MKKSVFILLILISSISLAQDKYFIYFKDKGIKPLEKISKTSQVYKDAVNTLSEKAIERRMKVLGDDYISYQDLPVNEEYIQVLSNSGIKIHNRLKWFNAVSAYLTGEQINEIKDLKFIEKIEKVQKLVNRKEFKFERNNENLNKVNKSGSSLNYGTSFTQLSLSNIPVVHRAGINGRGVRIGLLDSGFGWQAHESLQNAKVIKEYDFIFQDSITANQPGDISSQHNHGTYVFSIVGGYKEGSLIGSAYGSEFILSKTEDIRSERNVEEDNYAAALEWMEGLGADITSSSLGYRKFDEGEESYTYEDMDGKTTIVTQAANMAFDRGVITLTAAGNEGNDRISAPGDAYNIITVGAVSSQNNVASFSSRGPTSDGRIKPDVVTMGVAVYGASTGAFDRYSSGQGTSAATPIASGIAGLLLSAYPHLTNIQIRNIFHMSGDNWASPDAERGYGLLFADRALEYPNIEAVSGGTEYILHKAFLDTLGVQSGTAKMVLAVNDSNSTTYDLLNDSSVFYRAALSGFNQGEMLKLCFTYTNTAGQEKRHPETGLYELNYGTNEIITNANEINNQSPEEYLLHQNYPNPFNSTTNIIFYSAERNPAELIIYDIIGQQVKQYNITAEAGRNTLSWDGTSDKGIVNSSGVYFYILRIAGKEFSKKMILLR